MERETLKLALEALENKSLLTPNEWKAVYGTTITAIQDALAQPAQEPVARVSGTYGGRFTYDPINRAMVLSVGMALYTTPLQRTWAGLTEEDSAVVREEESCSFIAGAKWAEEILRGKNT